jgi:hypothetical protein
MRLFADAQRHGVPFSSNLADLIRVNAYRLGQEGLADDGVIDAFLSVLRSPYRVC